MIHSLTISNFFSVKNEQTFDFRVAKNVNDFDERFASRCGDMRIPRVVAIYGANASGKTTVLKALSFIAHFISNSFEYKTDEDIAFEKFRSVDTEETPTKIEVEFCIPDDNTYETHTNYRYSVNLVKEKVISESLYYSPKGRFKKLFERNDNKILAGKDFELPTNDPVRKKVRKNASVISLLEQFNHPFSLRIAHAVKQFFTNVNVQGKIPYIDLKTATMFYTKNPKYLDELNQFIQWSDLGIESVNLEDDHIDGKKPMFKHMGLDYKLDFEEESGGTRGLYRLLPMMFSAIETGGLCVLDELDADIHPLLLPKILNLFQDEKRNKNNAQLIISAHDVTMMSALQKEEIYFTAKTPDGATDFYGLTDIKGVRRSDNFYVKYLAGVYGAIPSI